MNYGWLFIKFVDTKKKRAPSSHSPHSPYEYYFVSSSEREKPWEVFFFTLASLLSMASHYLSMTSHYLSNVLPSDSFFLTKLVRVIFYCWIQVIEYLYYSDLLPFRESFNTTLFNRIVRRICFFNNKRN